MTIGLKHRALRALGHAPYFKGKDRIIRAFAPPDRLPSTPFEAPFFGRVYPGDLSSFLDWRVFFYGAYSPDELAVLSDVADTLRLLRPRLTYYDIGGNVGHHSLFMSARVDAVHAFEPFAPVAAKFREKVERNDLSNVTLHQIALSDCDGTAEFSTPTGSNHGTGSLAHAVGEMISVPIRHGDRYLSEHSLPRIDILKIDVEGHEAAVLAGLQKRLITDRPVILTEISGLDRSGFGTEAAFRRAVYDDHEVFGVRSSGAGYALRPFKMDGAHEVLVVPCEETALLQELQTKLSA